MKQLTKEQAMAQYIDKSAVVAEIEKRIVSLENIGSENYLHDNYPEQYAMLVTLKSLKFSLNTLDVKEAEELASIAYVVTRCEEHSDYVEGVFFDENKAQAYCDQFKGNENEYARHITKVEVTL